MSKGRNYQSTKYREHLRILRKLNDEGPPDSEADDNERFVHAQCARYLSNILCAGVSLDKNAVKLLAWIVGNDISSLFDCLKKIGGAKAEKKINEILEEDLIEDADDFAGAVMRVAQVCSASARHKLQKTCVALLQEKARNFLEDSAACIGKNIQSLKATFNATDREVDLCLFVFINETFNEADGYFNDILRCLRFEGRKYLRWALGLTQADLDAIINCNLRKAGMIEYDSQCFSISGELSNILGNDSPDFVIKEFCELKPGNTVNLKHHIITPQQTCHILSLLGKKPDKSTHILLYGPPGTGKTSFAQGIAARLDLPAYEIRRPDDSNSTSCRRAALIACYNLTCAGERGSLIIVDEADTILNTEKGGFFFFGKSSVESRDKAWLNYYMDQPGARVIWIVNDASDIDPSVMRRFAFSAYFSNFNRTQRVVLWNTVLERRGAARLLNEQQVASLASQYSVSAGVIDLAVEKAAEIAPAQAEGFYSAVCMGIEAHTKLVAGGHTPARREKTEKAYSLKGLNINGDLQGLMSHVEAYDSYLKDPDSDLNVCMNILFYGPPGTGKSELARYIAEHLGRELMVRRASDLISKWVGESEQNIAKVFAEAGQSGAVLVIDEADSFIFSRDTAVRSWETMQVNEFLTQMERFRGILICTTNRMTGIDEASIRRFSRKIEFNFLTPQGAEIFYIKLCAPLTAWPLDKKSRERLRGTLDLAPGDFKTVRDRYCLFKPDTINHQMLVGALEEEAVMKTANTGKKIIGFTAQGKEKTV
ncbi:MAG: ATP-binding protein [Deltaproteobacteria bacterium]|nr:ATP-binding protein [Deltaproteobacteria bacterium]